METLVSVISGKRAKANNKDNYWGSTLFPTLCKIYEMVLLNRLKNTQLRKAYFLTCSLALRRGSDVLKRH